MREKKRIGQLKFGEEKEKMGKDERGCGILPLGECKELPENI